MSLARVVEEKSIARNAMNGEYGNGHEYAFDHRGGHFLMRRIWMVWARALVLR
jgi:hypothetical protein